MQGRVYGLLLRPGYHEVSGYGMGRHQCHQRFGDPQYASSEHEKLYTVKEVSILLRANPAFVYRLIDLGLLPALKLGSIRVRKDALDAFLRRYEGHDLSDPNNIKALVKAG